MSLFLYALLCDYSKQGHLKGSLDSVNKGLSSRNLLSLYQIIADFFPGAFMVYYVANSVT